MLVHIIGGMQVMHHQLWHFDLTVHLTDSFLDICFGRIMHMAFPVLEPYNKMDIVAKLYISFSFTACACVGPLVRQLSMHIFNL